MAMERPSKRKGFTADRETIEAVNTARLLVTFAGMLFDTLENSESLEPRQSRRIQVDPRDSISALLTSVSGNYHLLRALLLESDQARVIRWIYHPRAVDFDGAGHQSYSMAAMSRSGPILGLLQEPEAAGDKVVDCEALFSNWPTARKYMLNQAYDHWGLGGKLIEELTAIQDAMAFEEVDAMADELADPKNYSQLHPVGKHWLIKYDFGQDTWKRRLKSGRIRVSSQSTSRSAAVFYRDWPPGYSE